MEPYMFEPEYEGASGEEEEEEGDLGLSRLFSLDWYFLLYPRF
jgi:hypothetical protein